MRIVMLRHGLTQTNLKKQYIGRIDDPLCAEGIDALSKNKPDESVLKVYTSGKIRTKQTARILYPNAEIIQCGDLDEIDFGDFEGKSYADLVNNPDYVQWLESGCSRTCPNGEDKKHFTDRCVRTFLDIVQIETAPLYFVVHGGTIMAILSALSATQRDYFSWSVPCGTGYELEYSDEKLVLIRERGAL